MTEKQNNKKMPKGILVFDNMDGLYYPNYQAGSDEINESRKFVDGNFRSPTAFYENGNEVFVGDNPQYEYDETPPHNLFELSSGSQRTITDENGNVAPIFAISGANPFNGKLLIGGGNKTFKDENDSPIMSYEQLDKEGVSGICGIFPAEGHTGLYLHVDRKDDSNRLWRKSNTSQIVRYNPFGNQPIEKVMELGEYVRSARMIGDNQYLHTMDDKLAINGKEIDGSYSEKDNFEAIAAPYQDKNNMYVVTAEACGPVGEYKIDKNSMEVKGYRKLSLDEADGYNAIHPVRTELSDKILSGKK